MAILSGRVDQLPQPLAAYISDIESALGARLEYPALALALALPDICATMETTNCETDKDLYAAWCDKWVTTSQKAADTDPGRFLTGAELYALRCAFLHNGSEDLNRPPGIPPQVLRRYEVRRRELSPGGGKVSIRDWNTGTVKLSAARICEDVARGVRAWFIAVAEVELVRRNLETLLDLDRSSPS